MEKLTNTFSHHWDNLVRLGFTLLYNQFAFSYDAVSWLVSLGLWQEWQRAAISYLQGPKVLEIAHGPGHMLIAMKQAGYEVTGTDLSSHMLQLAQNRVGPHFPIVRSMVQKLPFQENTFDSVVSTFPSDFILEQSSLKSVNHVIKPGGRFIIVPFAQLKGTNPYTQFIKWLYVITSHRSQPITENERKNSLELARTTQIKSIFHSAGFKLKIKKVVVKNSEVTLFLAQKPKLGLTDT